jgi:putative DNA-invertase from lambdoid prophage Rac
MIYGYTRVSTDKQDAQRQRTDLLEAANKAGLMVESWVEEKISSRNGDRMIFPLVAKLQRGDTILVTELSRIGRSLREINKLVEECRQRGASILTANNGERLGEGMSIAGEALLFALGIGAQIERDLISERTKSGLRAARAKGKKLGRPAGVSKLDVKAAEIAKYLALGVNKADVARIVGCSRSLLNAWLQRKDKA